MSLPHRCPNCGAPGLDVFYEVRNVPAHSVLLLHSRAAARSYPRGDIRLGVCGACGFVSNVAFDPTLHEYSQQYEATQKYSPTFSRFNTAVAQRLIDRYDLHDKQIIEIGCGHGEFLIMLCELGPNRGIGFDPAYDPARIDHPAKARITFIQDFYSEKYAGYRGDFVCCKMTLEHIPNTAVFMQNVRRAIGNRPDTAVFFQVPNAAYVLRDVAFWDIYYEHCSYFNRGSLACLLERSGFEVLDLVTEYNDQYLMAEARPAAADVVSEQTRRLIAAHRQDVEAFRAGIAERLAFWRRTLADLQRRGQRVVIWGGGSKGVAFLTTLGRHDAIDCVVDINPVKHGSFLAGTGHKIVGPERLRAVRPDVVIIMNPIYRDEIRRSLQALGLDPELRTV